MSKPRRPRLSWFRFYADDFLGGTGALTAPECGRYLLLLLHQWGTKERQSIPSDPERLRVICRGEDPGPLVLSKFDPIDGGLRNQRLAEEWLSARHEYDRKAEGGGTQIPGEIAPRIVGQIPSRILPPTKNQEPRTKTSLQEGRTEGLPPAYPPEQRAENATKETIHRLQLRLGEWLCKLAEHPNSRAMVPDWSRTVTSYEREGKKVKGVPDYRTVFSIDRLERSIEDAQWWWDKLEAGEVVSGAR